MRFFIRGLAITSFAFSVPLSYWGWSFLWHDPETVGADVAGNMGLAAGGGLVMFITALAVLLMVDR